MGSKDWISKTLRSRAGVILLLLTVVIVAYALRPLPPDDGEDAGDSRIQGLRQPPGQLIADSWELSQSYSVVPIPSRSRTAARQLLGPKDFLVIDARQYTDLIAPPPVGRTFTLAKAVRLEKPRGRYQVYRLRDMLWIRYCFLGGILDPPYDELVVVLTDFAPSEVYADVTGGE